jgi:uncharacterized protein (DUF488 family)
MAIPLSLFFLVQQHYPDVWPFNQSLRTDERFYSLHTGFEMRGRIYTLGYEGLSIDAFIRRLKSSGVECVIDVRAVPLSRKRGFSKKSFADALREAGLVYEHLPTMGCPKPIRDRYKRDKNWSAYTQAFMPYLMSQTVTVKDLAVKTSEQICCLVCFEADYHLCHRTFVARAAAKINGFSITHITDQKAIADDFVLAAA